MKKLKLNFASVFLISMALVQTAGVSVARADDDKFDRCGDLEEQVQNEIQKAVDKQGSVLKYKLRNEAFLKALVAAGEKDDALAAVYKSMRGHPQIDAEARIKDNDLITTWLHDHKLSTPKAFITCPAGYEVDESQLSTRLWKPDYAPADGHTPQALSDESDISKACQPEVDPHYAPDSSVAALESTSVSTSFGDQWRIGAKMDDPQPIAITSVDRPVTIKFRGKTMVVSRLGVMTYLHLKDGSFEHVDETVFLHDTNATIDGHDVDLESYVDNELLPPECKDFHYSPVADGGGSGNGGKQSAFNKVGGDQTSATQPKDAIAFGGFDNSDTVRAAAKAPAVRPAN